MTASVKDLRRLHRMNVARGVPICGFTGINGAGKTTLAAQSILHDLAKGRDVVSTVPIVSEWGSTEPVLSLRQLLELKDTTILLDDVAVIFSSRSTGSLPPEIVAMLQTVRHRKNTLIWTAPAWMRCDNLVREVTQGLVNVVPMLRKSDPETPWSTPRFVLAGLLDTSVGKTDETPTRVLRRRIFIPKRLDSFGTFDTHADTPLLGRHLQSGACVDCGGTRTREKCSPERHNNLGIPYYGDAHAMSLAASATAVGPPSVTGFRGPAFTAGSRSATSEFPARDDVVIARQLAKPSEGEWFKHD